jgi:Skp family chaperone for outer membrane proteins
MKRFSFIAVVFVFAAISAVSAFGQGAGPATSVQPAKIVVINTAAFDSKEGITKYANAMTALETEFKPAQTEIQSLMTRYQTLATEIENARKATAVPIKPETIQAKVDEAQGLEIQIKRKQEDGKVKFEKRQQAVLGPILQDIMKAMDDFAKQKGFALILDAAKLEGAGLILAVDLPKVDVTKDFITFYNARPATTATTATPR